jgi:hypothetical protein
MNVIGGVRTKDSIFSVVLDGDTAICHTEATLDTWWAELKPEDKAALYELHLEGALDADTPASINPAWVAGMSTIQTAGKIMMDAQAAKVELMLQSAQQVLAAKGITANLPAANPTQQ